jgi:hypothetical protein
MGASDSTGKTSRLCDVAIYLQISFRLRRAFACTSILSRLLIHHSDASFHSIHLLALFASLYSTLSRTASVVAARSIIDSEPSGSADPILEREERMHAAFSLR